MTDDPQRRPSVSDNKSKSQADKDETISCVICKKEVIDGAIECEICQNWHHIECVGVSKTELKFINNHTKFHWFCPHCDGKVIDMIKNVKEMNDKYDQLRDEFNNKQLDVQKKQDEMMKILNDILDKQSNQTAPTGNVMRAKPNQDESMVREMLEREKRQNNIEIRNLKEDGNEATNLDRIWIELGVQQVEVNEMNRIGRNRGRPTGEDEDEEVKPRLIRVVLKSKQSKYEILRGANKLKESVDFRNVFISPDQTRMQRIASAKLRQELKSRRQNGKQDLVIFKGEIITKTVKPGGTVVETEEKESD
jgi:hypothetical protein